MEDLLYQMGLHQQLTPATPAPVCITRVPGGWVYTIYSHVHPDSYHVSSVFVPFHNEFQTVDEF